MDAFNRVHHNELNKEEAKCSNWDFRNKDWSVDYIDHDSQKDTWNRGVCCVNFARNVLLSSPDVQVKLKLNGNVDVNRQWYASVVMKLCQVDQSKKVQN